MAIFLTENSRVVVQGMTGSEGRKHTQRMLSTGANIVGGVNPRKAGEQVEFTGPDGPVLLPVFGSVAEAVEKTAADVSVVFVPPAGHQGRGLRGGRRRDAAGRRHHRGRPGARHR